MNTNTRVSPKDFFLHLGTTIALYASTIAVIDLAFAALNRALPDALSNYFNASSIVWPISILIVLVPILYILEGLISRDIARTPEKRKIWIRKWRIYLTLFLTGVTIAVDIIVLINTYLNGEISSRFIWKVITVLIVSTVIFAYYLLDKNATFAANDLLTGERPSMPARSKKIWLRILSVSGIVLVLAGIVSGFIIVGSPNTQRAMKFDEQRVNDLSNIQYQIINYWQRTGKLPLSLQALNDPISNFNIPVDPETAKPYEYYGVKINNPNMFSLCATFIGSSSVQASNSPTYPVYEALNSDWSHPAGYNCFSRTIDPTKYPVMPK